MRKQRFFIVELLFVIAILAIIGSISAMFFNDFLQKRKVFAKESTLIDFRQLASTSFKQWAASLTVHPQKISNTNIAVDRSEYAICTPRTLFFKNGSYAREVTIPQGIVVEFDLTTTKAGLPLALMKVESAKDGVLYKVLIGDYEKR
jgi:type II secretory pathway pseudopilin PulG